MIAIIDYGAGNIFSVKNALDYLGYENKLTDSADDIINADAIILPGVGAFPWAMNKLYESGLVDTIKEQAKVKPFLGICLGMQLLFEKSYEFEACEGLGLIPGKVDKIDEPDLVIPHMGWNKLEYNRQCPLFNGLSDEEYVYFVHSYKAYCNDENLYAYCDYGHTVPALVSDGKYIYGAQFHPEKSGKTGLKILKNFAELANKEVE
ncbi:MAG: imidazole glycerol phosphate synthase subunit HisH [Ruminococcus sp.]|nr:imidazole glycerol phosphate synthase subunit HisH [Ruminococcus sp.]